MSIAFMDMDNMSPAVQAAYLLFAFCAFAGVFMYLQSQLGSEDLILLS
jgi:hypothetical protein